MTKLAESFGHGPRQERISSSLQKEAFEAAGMKIEVSHGVSAERAPHRPARPDMPPCSI